MANEIHKDDIGTVFEVTVQENEVAIDISTATVKEIILSDPDGTPTTFAAAFKTDGTDGIIQYTTVASDLSIAGNWRIQARLTLPAGDWRTDVGKFIVHENL